VTDRRLLLTLYTASQYVGAIVERQLAAVGLPSHLFGLLSHVDRLAPVSPSEISAASGVPMTTLRDNIQRLVDRDLARRDPNPADARSYLLALTRKGKLLARAADPALLEAYLALEERLPRPLKEYEAVLAELNAALAQVAELTPLQPPTRARART
jgi:MarR family transcriptional regulator, temperature-dependent positive regulator of motility